MSRVFLVTLFEHLLNVTRYVNNKTRNFFEMYYMMYYLGCLHWIIKTNLSRPQNSTQFNLWEFPSILKNFQALRINKHAPLPDLEPSLQ